MSNFIYEISIYGCTIQNACEFLYLLSKPVWKPDLFKSMLHHLNDLFDPVPTKIVYCYGEHQAAFDDMVRTMDNIQFVEGFPDNLHDITSNDKNSLVMVEDLMSECSKDQRMSNLFARVSHNNGISVMYLTQNLFPPGKQSRTISLNSH